MRKVSPGRGAATSGGSGGAALTVRGKKKKEPSKRGKLTRKDIHKERAELPALTKKLVKRLVEGDAEIKENAAFAILHILEMDHGIHADTIFKAKTVKPLVALLTNGSANAQTNAAAALAGIAACAARSRCAHLWVLALPCPCLPLADPEVLGRDPPPAASILRTRRQSSRRMASSPSSVSSRRAAQRSRRRRATPSLPSTQTRHTKRT